MPTRRRFISQATLTAFSFALGSRIVYGNKLPEGIVPIGLNDPIKGKHPGLTILNDRPVNAETPAHLLDDPLTPNDRFFVRNNGIPPENPEAGNWSLTIEGESARQSKTFTLAELKANFRHHTYQITLECGGNGRSEFNPPAKGNQWSTGAVGCAAWTGVRLKDVLQSVGVKSDAVYIGYYGADTHLSGNLSKTVISRGVPIKKAMQEESLIAWEMNGEPLPLLNGFPLRLIFGGYPASASGKWLNRIVIRNQVHDGPKMTGQAYRVPCKPVAPGAKVADDEMCIIEKMPVKSLITFPKTGATIKSGQQLPIRGHAWAADAGVSKMEYSIDFGSTWQTSRLENAANRFAWQHFSANIDFPENGYYEIWARATDGEGNSQPMILPGWNPKGYLNNACHRIAVRVV
ncbi:molybdopterin containing oxidoreductase [Lewinellaceae bacterium SD302]|nr:molybdopterin containing oxidoreductase [Lewinellaceae bacterium SD302]